MTPGKRAIREGWVRQNTIRLGPISVVCLMVLWGLLMIAPAALPH
jgi:hypothetical protein